MNLNASKPLEHISESFECTFITFTMAGIAPAFPATILLSSINIVVWIKIGYIKYVLNKLVLIYHPLQRSYLTHNNHFCIRQYYQSANSRRLLWAQSRSFSDKRPDFRHHHHHHHHQHHRIHVQTLIRE